VTDDLRVLRRELRQVERQLREAKRTLEVLVASGDCEDTIEGLDRVRGLIALLEECYRLGRKPGDIEFWLLTHGYTHKGDSGLS
jgi:hypothetical protein